MSASELKNLTEEKSFLGKVKELRYDPLVVCNDNTWNDLSEVLRVAKDPGPVDFRRIVHHITQLLKNEYRSDKIATTVRKFSRSNFPFDVTATSCFETKYNALNALLDIALLLVEKPLGFDPSPMQTLSLLLDAISTVGNMFDDAECARIVAEARSEPELSSPGTLDDVLLRMNMSVLSRDGNVGDRLLLGTVMGRNMARKTSELCKSGVLVKTMVLRWEKHGHSENLTGSITKLDLLLDSFQDRSVIADSRFLGFVERSMSILLRASHSGIYYPSDRHHLVQVRYSIDRAASRISKRASRTSSLKTRLAALEILSEVALRILEPMHPSRPYWHKALFQDNNTEGAVTEAMMAILRSLSKDEWDEMLKAERFHDDLREICLRQRELPDALIGLDAVLRTIQDPEHLRMRESKRAKVATVSKVANVIDLTDD